MRGLSSPRDPDAVSLRDIYDLSKEIDGKLDQVNDRCTRLEGRVGTLERKEDDRRTDRRSWRDYIVNGLFVIFASVISFFIGSRT